MELRHLLLIGLIPLSLTACVHDRSALLLLESGDSLASAQGEPPEGELAPLLMADSLVTGGALSLQNCLRFGLQENLNIRTAELGRESISNGVEFEKAAFDPALYAFGGREYQIDGTEFEEAEAGIQKRFVTGTTLSLEGRYTSDTFVNSSFNSGFPNGFTSAQPGGISSGSQLDDFVESLTDEDLTLRLRQSLLRGNSIRANRAGIDLARLAVDAADTTVRAQVLEFLRGAEIGYWTAAVASEIYLQEEGGLEQSRQILEDTKLRLDVGTASILDILEAEAGYAKAQETTMRARQRYEDSIDNLWLILGLPLGSQEKDLAFQPIDEDIARWETPDPEESYNEALESYPDVLLLANNVRQNQVRLGVAKNNLLPALDVEMTGRYRSKDDFLPEEIERDYDWGVLLQLSIPWTFRAERAELRRAKADLEQSQVSRENAKRTLKRDILSASRAIDFNKKQLEVAVQRAIVDNKKFEEQQLRFREGLVSIRDLIEDQEAARNSRTQELEARLRLIAAWKLLEQLDGSILRQRGFTWYQ